MKKITVLSFVLILFSCGKENLEHSSLLNVYTPNAFNPGSTVPCPNGDPSCNQVYKPLIDKPGNLKSFTMQILDLKQNLIFKTDNYLEGWNGHISNKMNRVSCPQGQYRLIINYTDVANGNYQIKKDIYMLR